jgi:hypothetical protein
MVNAPGWLHIEAGDVTVEEGRRVLTLKVRIRPLHPGFWLWTLRCWRLGRARSA